MAFAHGTLISLSPDTGGLVDIATIHLKGDVIQSYNCFEHTYRVPTWKEFKSGLLIHFRLTEYKNTNGQLMKIRQTSTVQEYQTRFKHLSNQTQDWSEKQLQGTVIEGLKPEIKCEVKAQQPYTLRAAISFACIHEERLNNNVRRTKIMNRPTTIKPSSSPAANRTFQPNELTQEELCDRFVKGL
ncbi:hypothetical protein B296_00039088 [Ensete ventricosum]|uniref:Retrotransposon gag domain-containing protein n=1 Tax=Ensete ventricosum TaxID=4639 RepID=A0A426XRV2_ENSVE|nr:hypothetical protein B296_00039088 [Ensete ventricosum]